MKILRQGPVLTVGHGRHVCHEEVLIVMQSLHGSASAVRVLNCCVSELSRLLCGVGPRESSMFRLIEP